MLRHENIIDKSLIENHAFDLAKTKLKQLVSKGVIKNYEYKNEEWNQEYYDISFSLWFDLTNSNNGEIEPICFDYDVVGDEFTCYYDGKITAEAFEVSSPLKVNWF